MGEWTDMDRQTGGHGSNGSMHRSYVLIQKGRGACDPILATFPSPQTHRFGYFLLMEPQLFLYRFFLITWSGMSQEPATSFAVTFVRCSANHPFPIICHILIFPPCTPHAIDGLWKTLVYLSCVVNVLHYCQGLETTGHIAVFDWHKGGWMDR